MCLHIYTAIPKAIFTALNKTIAIFRNISRIFREIFLKNHWRYSRPFSHQARSAAMTPLDNLSSWTIILIYSKLSQSVSGLTSSHANYRYKTYGIIALYASIQAQNAMPDTNHKTALWPPIFIIRILTHPHLKWERVLDDVVVVFAAAVVTFWQ